MMPQAEGRVAFIRQPAQGQTVGVVGDVYRLLVTGAESGGDYAIMEAIVPPGGGPPPHRHTRESEAFLVLQGEITFRIGDETIVARAGEFAHLPRGVPHSFRNESQAVATMIVTVAPAGLEEMFLRVGQRLDKGATVSPPPAADEIQRLKQLAPQYGIELLI